MRGLGLGIVVALLALPAAARAETYCVGSQQGCQGTPATLQVALTMAAGSAADDRILIGEGTFVGPFTYAPTTEDSGSLAVRGQGPGKTILTSTAPGSTVLNLLAFGEVEPDTSVFSLGVSIPDGGTGINTYGSLESINATAQPGADDVTGLRTNGSARLQSISATLPPASTAVSAEPAAGSLAGQLTLYLLTAEAGRGADLRNEARIAGARIVSSDFGVRACSATAGVYGTVVVAAGGRGIAADSQCGNAPASVRAGHNTIVGESGSLTALTSVGRDAHIGLDSSVVRGFPHAFFTQGGHVSARYSLVDLAAAQSGSTAPAIDKGNNLNTDPLFVDAAGRDYAVSWASPLIDAADPAGSAEADAINGQRFLDGDGDGVWRADIGAYEYGGPMPRIAAPARAFTGEPVTFDGSASTVLYAPLTHVWTFDDGTTLTGGLTTSRVFRTPGPHSVTLTLTDGAGHTASRTATVLVVAPTSDTPPPRTVPKPGGEATPDTTPPVLTGVKVRKGKWLEWSLTEHAAVTIGLQRCRKARGGRCVRWTKARTTTRLADAGTGTLRLARAGRGRWRVHVVAADASGNRSDRVTVRFRR